MRRAHARGRARGGVPRNWRIASSLRTPRRLTRLIARRLGLDVRLFVLRQGSHEGAPPVDSMRALYFVRGIGSGSIGGVPLRFWRWTVDLCSNGLML
jgi:hypothetical protein